MVVAVPDMTTSPPTTIRSFVSAPTLKSSFEPLENVSGFEPNVSVPHRFVVPAASVPPE